MRHFTSRFLRLTSPIPGIRVAPFRQTVGKMCHFTSRFTFDLANPFEGLRVAPKMCNFTSRSVAQPGQSIAKIDTSRKIVILRRVQTLDQADPHCKKRRWRLASRPKCFTTRSDAFSPSTRQIHCKNRGAERLNKMCNFTSRSVHRPRQSIVKIDASRRTVGKMCHFTSHFCV